MKTIKHSKEAKKNNLRFAWKKKRTSIFGIVCIYIHMYIHNNIIIRSLKKLHRKCRSKIKRLSSSFKEERIEIPFNFEVYNHAF